MSLSNFYNTSQKVSVLAPFPVDTEQGLPYNYSHTPFFGDTTTYSTSDALNAASITYNNTTVTWSSVVQTMANAVTPWSSGSTRGTSSEVTADFLGARWQEFFYFFEPFIDNTTFTNVVEAVEDNGLAYPNATYYTNLFQTCFVPWMVHRKAHNDSQGDNFITYLQDNDISTANNMQFRQRNVILWQLQRVVAMIDKLNHRTINAGLRETTWVSVANVSLNLIAGQSIPALSGSSEDVRVPDPDSLQSQNDAQMKIEKWRANYKQAEQTIQIQDSTLSVANDASAQQRTALDSFWGSLTNIMNSIVN